MRTLYNVFAEHISRRRAILRAVTAEADLLLSKCNPNKTNVCLYGHPNGLWEVRPPSEEVPSELPEPMVGINYARASMTREDWLSLVAIYSDSWLISLAFFSGARMDREEREEMFQLINRLPTCYEIVTGVRKCEEWEIAAELALQDMRSILEQQDPDIRYMDNSDESDLGQSEDVESNSEEESEIGVSEPEDESKSDSEDLPIRPVVHENNGDSNNFLGKAELENWEEDDDSNPCPLCGNVYMNGEFWIACDFCDSWYCGTCAGMDEENAQEVSKWKCTDCEEKEII